MMTCRYIREDADRSSYIKRAVGNVTVDTEITFEYGIRRRRRNHADTGMSVCVCVCVTLMYLYM